MFRNLHIGIDRYADSRIPWLGGAVRDAEALHALFSDTFGDDGQLLTDEAATVAAIRDALTTLATAADDDIIVITYADYEDSELDEFAPRVVHVDTATRPVDEATAAALAQAAPGPVRYVEIEAQVGAEMARLDAELDGLS